MQTWVISYYIIACIIIAFSPCASYRPTAASSSPLIACECSRPGSRNRSRRVVTVDPKLRFTFLFRCRSQCSVFFPQHVYLFLNLVVDTVGRWCTVRSSLIRCYYYAPTYVRYPFWLQRVGRLFVVIVATTEDVFTTPGICYAHYFMYCYKSYLL